MKFPIRAPLYWCHNCNVPIVDAGICSACDERGEELRLYPPADVRPAFRNDLEFIRSVVRSQYGKAAEKVIPLNKIVLLNKTPAIDHLDDIIVDGHSIGSIGFDPFRMKWLFRPRAEGAKRIGDSADKRFVKVNSGARRYVRRERDIFSSNIAEVGPEVSKGDYVLIYSNTGDIIGVGKVMKDMREGESAVAVRVSSHVAGSSGVEAGHEQVSSSPHEGGQDWQQVISCNEETLNRREQKAKRFIVRAAARKSDLPKAISFSGGKDSLSMLLLSGDIVNGPVVFIDTGLELPETIEHTHEIVPKLGFELVEEKAGDIFWESLDVFGPPSRDYRWCCKTSKLSPIVKLTKERFPRGCLMFVGQRRYESLTRARRPDIWINPWIPVNVEASPINDWTALHVWLYLMRKKVTPNPLYFEGMDRIGCWLCPACEMAEFKIVENKHPDLWGRWNSFLRNWSKKIGYDERWVTHGLWRWRKYPGNMRDFITTQNIDVTPKRAANKEEPLTLTLVGGMRPCGRGGISVEGAFNRPPQIESVANILNSVGIVKETKGAIRVWSKETEIYLFNDGRAVINSSNELVARNHAMKLAMAITRVERCIKCGSCASICPTGSMVIDAEGPSIDEEKCSHCGLCNKVCPVAYFGTKGGARSGIFGAKLPAAV
ncbi:MAG: phosphoadenosine phosphosulfate reductase family protein [Promethearchaeati archaeon SRVP18_Atabeyarchaeia-1]